MKNVQYEYISVPVTWILADLTKINEYGKSGWKFVCYTPVMPCFAIFENKVTYKSREG